MRKALPYFRWYPADAETDENFRAMTDAEIGYYIRCLNHSWMNGGLPADSNERARIMRVTPKYDRKAWDRVGRCFQLSSDGTERLVNPRQEHERRDAIEKSEKARRSVQTRYESSTDEPTNVGTNEQRQGRVALRASESVSESPPLESFTLQEPKNGQGTSTGWREARFNQFWAVVWAKIGKDAARKSFDRKAKTQVDADRIIAAAKAQGPEIVAHSERHDHSILHPSTWLNQGRYDDEGVVVQPKTDDFSLPKYRDQ